MRKENILIIAIFAAVLIGGGVLGMNLGLRDKDIETDNTIYSLETVSGDCTDNETPVIDFLNDSEAGNAATLNITRTNAIHTQSIVYDGENFTYTDGETTKTYSYFYSVTGTSPNSEIQKALYILANERYSFKQINWSIFSSQSTDHLDIIRVCYAIR